MSFFAPKSELALAFDIGSSSVGAALIYLPRRGHARVLHKVHVPMPYQEKMDAGRLFKEMIEALKRAHLDVVKEGALRLAGTEWKHVRPGRAYYSFSSPWSATQTKTLFIKTDKPFVFTREFLNKIMLDEEEKFKKQAIGDKRVFPEALSVIDRRIIQTKLHGYDIKDPFGKKTKEAEISYFSGIAPRSVMERVLEVSHAAHVQKNVKTFTFPLVAFASIHESFPNDGGFIHLRVGGEISDVSIVSEGVIASSGSFPVGYNHIVRGLSEEAGMQTGEAVSFLKLYMEKKAAKEQVEKFSSVISKKLDDWLSAFSAASKRVDGYTPSKTYITTDGEFAGLFAEGLKAKSFVPVVLDQPLDLLSGFVGRMFELEVK